MDIYQSIFSTPKKKKKRGGWSGGKGLHHFNSVKYKFAEGLNKSTCTHPYLIPCMPLLALVVWLWACVAGIDVPPILLGREAVYWDPDGVGSVEGRA